MTDDDWSSLLKKAKQARACDKHYNIAASYSSFEEASQHSDAPQWAYWYARNVIKGRWPEAEAVIMQDAFWAYWYALDVLEGRWPEAELAIIGSAKWAYHYACDVIKGRWPEAEPVIASSPSWAYWYALHVVKAHISLWRTEAIDMRRGTAAMSGVCCPFYCESGDISGRNLPLWGLAAGLSCLLSLSGGC